MATDFIPAENVSIEKLADAAQLSSLSDETPEGRSIAVSYTHLDVYKRQPMAGL